MAHNLTRMLNFFLTIITTKAFAQSRANFLTNQPSITNTDIANPFPSAPKPPLIQLFGEQRPYEDVSSNTVPNPLGINDLNGLVTKIVDALTVIANFINGLKAQKKGVLLITHYDKLLDLIAPDMVHVMKDGCIVESGGMDLVKKIQQEGYAVTE